MKYAKRPDPEYRQRFISEQDDFRRWANKFHGLADRVAHSEWTDQTLEAYETFVRLGQAVIDAKDRERAASGKFVETLSSLHQTFDDILNLDTQPFGTSVKGIAAAEALQDVQANLNELTLFLFAYMEMGAEDAWVEVEAHSAALEAGTTTLSTSLAGSEHHKWASNLASGMTALVSASLETIRQHKALQASIEPFIVQRQVMDALLDDKIQIISGTIVVEAKDDARAELRGVFIVLGLCALFSLAGAYFIVRRLAHQLITPVNELAAGASNLAASASEPKPLPIRSRDEVGALPKLFNEAASNAWQARNLLANSNRQVERDVAERTKDLEEARDAAEASSKAKSAFLANMSHELRTPLNAIIGFSDILKREMFGPLGDAHYPEYARLINDSGSMLLDLINDLLDMSRIEAQKFELHYEEIAVDETISSCVRLVSQRGEEKGITFTQQTVPSRLVLRADPRAVKQILLNLLSNAVKFTGPGGKIDVEAAADGAVLRLCVRDNGIGISAEDLPRLANPFEQASNDPTHTHGGSGLGLALVKSLARLHGGDVVIQSKEGHGTEVTVTLPLKPADAVRAA